MSPFRNLVGTNGWNELDHSHRVIAGRDGLPQDMVIKRWIRSGGASQRHINRNRIRMDDRWWMRGDG